MKKIEKFHGQSYRFKGVPASHQEKSGCLGFVCTGCQSRLTSVIDSRGDKFLREYIRRRRVCQKCGLRFTTVEIRADIYNDLVDGHGSLGDEIARAINEVFDRRVARLPKLYGGQVRRQRDADSKPKEKGNDNR